MTIGVRDTLYAVDNDEALIRYLSRLKTRDNAPRMSVSARRSFDELLRQAKTLVATLYNREAENTISKAAQRKDRLRVYSTEDITEGDLERMISSAIPVDKHGNLTPSKASKLNAQFAGKRFSRQHISEILNGKAEVTRFDLITLNFFVFSLSLDDYPNSKSRYVAFIESTNRILSRCLFGDLYITNPYECFILMCILSDDPLGTYADVWELSYREDV